MSSLGGFIRVRRLRPVPPVADELPQALFPARSQLVIDRDGHAFLRQLNRTYPLAVPVDWQLTSDPESTHLERLAFHYLEFLESTDLELATAIVLDWIDSNPPWQPGYWLDTWNSYAISIRTVCMMQWLACHRENLAAEIFNRVTASVAEQIRFLARNLELDIRGNHVMKNIKALLWAGRFFTGREPNDWHDRGLALLNVELGAQFLGDGLHFELSPAYHCQVFADVLECVSVLDESDGSRVLRLMTGPAQAVADLNHPDHRISLFGDGGLNMAYKPSECLAVYEALGGTQPSPRGAFGFEESGYYGARFDRSYVLFDCGPSCCDQLPAHGHGDILAFEWDVARHRIVVDAGVREYEIGAERVWNRSTRAHNTVTVGDRDQCEFIRNFRVGHRAHGQCEDARLDSTSICVSGCYTATSPDGQIVEHRRTFSATEGEVCVADTLESTRPEPAVARLLLHHDCAVGPTVDENGGLTISVADVTIELRTTAAIHIVDAKWSPDFGTEFPTKQIELHYGTTPCEGQFSLRVERTC